MNRGQPVWGVAHWPTIQQIPIQVWFGAGALAALWALESLAPLVATRESRARHGARNLALGAIGGLARAAFFPAALLALSEWCRQSHTGLFNRADVPPWGSALIAILVLDGWSYLWHVLSHKIPVLWRFHLVHHHDEAVDASTAFRFHVGDVFLTAATTLAIVPVLGLAVWHVLAYEALVLPFSAFHHANIALPERVDRMLRVLIVTPRMHRVHHSRWQPETDSDYGAIFSFWDRLFGTLRLRADPASLDVGLDGYSITDHASVRGCLLSPFGPIKSGPGSPPAQPAPASTLAPCQTPPKPATG